MQTSRRAYNANKSRIQNAVDNLKPGEYLRLRKLTERESLRLMGLSDEDITIMITSGVSSEQIYKQSGNSIVCDCLYHLFRKLFIDRGADIGQSEPLY